MQIKRKECCCGPTLKIDGRHFSALPTREQSDVLTKLIHELGPDRYGEVVHALLNLVPRGTVALTPVCAEDSAINDSEESWII